MAEKIKVLAVDDEKFNLMLLKGCLKSDTYDITGCTNAVDALQEFKKQFFDVILLDVLMPGIDGFELRKLIRQLDAERPIIFLTALVDDINTTMLNKISWDSYTYYMNKSFSKKLLSSKIQQAVGVYRGRKMVADYYHKLEDEMGLAGDIQRILLPNWCELYDTAMLCSYYAPCSKVSGDLFDFFPISPGRYMLFLGDIAGHGMQAALYMAAVQSYVKAAAARGATKPHELLNKLNDFFCEELGSGTYMTCLSAVLDFNDNTVTVQSAGHPGLLGCRRGGGDDVVVLGDNERGGLPIGWFASSKYLEEDTSVHSINDDTVILGYTDGILDVCDRDKQTMDESEFLSMIGALSASSDAATMPYRLRTALGQMGYDQSPDDICIVAIQKIPKSHPRDLSRIIQPKLPNVSETAIEFSGLLQRHGGSLELTTRVELLISEYLNNVIIHGSEGNSKNRQPIYIAMHVDDDKLSLRGLDRGKSWNLEGDTGDQNAEQLNIPTSGRGIQIIKDITDHVTHSNYCGLNETVFFINTKEEKATPKG